MYMQPAPSKSYNVYFVHTNNLMHNYDAINKCSIMTRLAIKIAQGKDLH